MRVQNKGENLMVTDRRSEESNIEGRKDKREGCIETQTRYSNTFLEGGMKLGVKGCGANDSWKGMRSKDITDEEADDDISTWGSVNSAEIIHNRKNEQSWAIRRRGTIAPRHFDCFEIERGWERGSDAREATGTVFEQAGCKEQESEGTERGERG